LPSAGVRVACAVPLKQRDRAIQRLQRAMRSLEIPIIGRVEEHALILDCRCLDDPQDVIVQAAQLGQILQNS
jgi:L-seryl-tRNA(Ser) seleniumtransferase